MNSIEMNAIAFSHVNKDLGGFAIQDLNLTVPSGAICGLVGENGAGKSTTIRLLMGALRPDSGSIQVLGVNADSPAFLQTKEDIGVVLDDGYFPDSLNAIQVGKVMADTYRRWEPETYADFLRRFELPEKKKFKDYSRGMRMKLGIAVALSHQARLLVLDEATAGLDPIVRDEVLTVFNEFTREEGHSILISSHILSDLEKLCDYIAFLHKGRLLFCEEKDRLLEGCGVFVGTTEQADSLLPEAVIAREASGYGGVRALVKRDMAPAGFQLDKPTVEDIILFTVKGEKQV
jgi:ABC-2 type transport system ATP-binding protein